MAMKQKTTKITPTTTPLRDQCLSHCTTLGIPLEPTALDELLSRAEKEGLSNLQFLDLLLGAQAHARRERGVARRIREAHFAEDRTLEGFDWQFNPEAFDRVLGSRPNQLERQRPEVSVTASQLTDVKVPGGTITENGLRLNVSVGVQYIESWMRGVGAAAINNLMEDVATAEISRSQVWQWIRHSSRLSEGPSVTADLVREIADDELSKIRERLGEGLWAKGRFAEAREVFEEVALSESFPAFLTLVAQRHID